MGVTERAPTRKKRIVRFVVASSGLVAVLASVALRGPLLESWYLRKLDSDDAGERSAAIEKLAGYGSTRAIPKLMKLFREDPGGDPGDPNVGVRLSSVGEALAKIGPKVAPAVFEESRNTRDPLVRMYAAILLAQVGADAVPVLLARLKSSDAIVRHTAADAFGRLAVKQPNLDAERPVQGLISRLKDENEDVRERAASTLGQFGTRASFAAGSLAEAVFDESPDVRARAAYALGKVGPAARVAVVALSKALEDEEPSVRMSAVSALASIGSIAKEAVPALSVAVADSSSIVREGAVKALRAMERSAAFSALVAAMASESATVAQHARVMLFERPPGADSVPSLVEILEQSEFAHSRKEAARVLSRIGPAAKAAADALKRALEDE
ncbi:MAG: HEAT repeat domain-containing protein, partial [Planctomycetota bacterium]